MMHGRKNIKLKFRVREFY